MEQPTPRNAIGDRVRRLRNARAWTQEQLAARCGVAGCDISRGTLAKIEARLRGVSDSELFVLARIFSVKMESLFPERYAEMLRRGQ